MVDALRTKQLEFGMMKVFSCQSVSRSSAEKARKDILLLEILKQFNNIRTFVFEAAEQFHVSELLPTPAFSHVSLPTCSCDVPWPVAKEEKG